jgi:hypothetical protein
MPSPFPGMDPYLEGPDWFPDLHGSLIFGLKEALQARLPEPYYAQSDQRTWLEYSQRYIEPDVNVLRSGRGTRDRGRVGAVAVAEPEEPVVVSVETVVDDEHTETFLEIRARRGDEIRVVTTIEVLSLANKAPGAKGRELYLSKQREVLDGQANLVEIDLLRGGSHATAVPRDLADAKAGPFDYHVVIHQFDRVNDYFVYPVRLEARLPVIPIPLLPGDPAVAIDLQAVLDRAYDAGPYRRAIRYGEDPIDPPLGPEQAEWAARRLAAAP